MLKNFGYDGAYHDEDISVSIMLENPLDWELETTALVFSVALRAKNKDLSQLSMLDFTFYIMDESNRLYNTEIRLCSKIMYKEKDNEPIRQPDGLVCADFKHEFLFQDLRIAFYYQPYEKLHIIKLQH